MNYFKLVVRILGGLLFSGFVLPLYLSHRTTISAMHQLTSPEVAAHSMPYSKPANDLAVIGYGWCACSMLWLFLRKGNRLKI